MASDYYEKHSDRSPLADVGMTVALAVTIVTLLKLLMYGLTIVSIGWLLLTLLYVLVTTISKPNSKVRKSVTIFYLLVSCAALYASFIYDNPILPKSESHLKKNNDEFDINEMETNDDVEIITPKPVPVETDNIVQEDESTFEDIGTENMDDNYNAPTMEGNDEDDVSTIPLDEIDVSANDYDENGNDNMSDEDKVPEFDDSFK